jgi:hypothetical protein
MLLMPPSSESPSSESPVLPLNTMALLRQCVNAKAEPHVRLAVEALSASIWKGTLCIDLEGPGDGVTTRIKQQDPAGG